MLHPLATCEARSIRREPAFRQDARMRRLLVHIETHRISHPFLARFYARPAVAFCRFRAYVRAPSTGST
jgi:hypothetical protein